MEWFNTAWHFELLAAGRTMLQQLDPVTRVRVLAALLGLIVLGMGLMLLAWLGARMARSYRERKFSATRREKPVRPNEDDWWQKPLNSEADHPDAGDERS